MRCPRCSHDAPPGADFCPECGARLLAAALEGFEEDAALPEIADARALLDRLV